MADEQKILKGFNAGYLIAKHKPELSKQLQKGFVNKDDDFVAGFIAGVGERESEVSKSRTRNYDTRHISQKGKSPNKDKDKDFREK